MANPDAQAAVKALLDSTRLSEMLKPQHVITIKMDASVDQTLRVRGLHAVP